MNEVLDFRQAFMEHRFRVHSQNALEFLRADVSTLFELELKMAKHYRDSLYCPHSKSGDQNGATEIHS